MKQFFIKLWSIKYYFLIFIIPFIFVNMFDYNNESLICFKPLQIFNIFSFSFIFSVSGFNFFVSLITVISVLLALIQWQSNIKSQNMADVNGLLEEIKLNIKVLGDYCCNADKNIFYKMLYEDIQYFSEITIYPEIINDNEYDKRYRPIIKKSNYSDYRFMELRNNFINTVVSSRTFFDMKPKRIYLNIGNLKYSIDKHNIFLNEYNNCIDNRNRCFQIFVHLQLECYCRLYYRLHCILIDLIVNTPESMVIDKAYYQEIKNILSI
jgi:hypothetical protein